MILHIDLGRDTRGRQRALASLIRSGDITMGGYKKGRIYGLLKCSSGKRMKLENRVFFKDEAEALKEGFRPCGNCLPEKYREWKKGLSSNS